MKKIISVLLLLAMCVACFAGCTPAEEGNDGLAAAKEYLYTMYKDEAEATGADYVVVGAVMIDGVSYSVTWTVDNDTVKVVPGDNKMVTIKIPEPTEEDVAYNLTATITDAEGKTETVTFAHKIPGAEKVAESVVLYFPDAEQYITGTDYIYTSSSGSQKHELTLSANKADAVPLTVRENDDGTVTFIAEGKFLFCDATNVQFVATEDDNTKFVLEATEGGYFIKCAVANYGGKAQYLEVYSGYLTCYGMNAEKANIYTFKLEDSTGASGVLKDAATETPDEEPEEKPEESKPADKPSTDAKPADVTLTNGMKVVIYAPSHGKALSSQPQKEGSYYQKGVDVTGYLTGYGDTEVWTVVINADNTISFAQGGKNLAMQDTYNSMSLGAKNDKWEVTSLGAKNDKWEVTSLGNGLYLIRNTVRDKYIEWYADNDNWSTYNTDGVATNSLFQMAFYVVG